MKLLSIAFVLLSVVFLTPTYAQDSTRLSLLFIGDIMQHDTQIAAAYEPVSGKYNYDPCFENVKSVFQSADLTIGNLELTLGGAPYKGYPNFSAPDELVHTLISSGVDVLVTANNHCLDRGKKGLQRTIAVLDTLKIPHTGTFVDSIHREKTYPLLLEKNGIKFSLLNYTYGTNGIVVTKPNVVNYIDTVQIAADIVKAKAQSPDLIIAFFHWGDEYQRLPNKSQKAIAEFCFRKGVKLVIGSHPHVLQPMEWRKENDQLLVYSLGNFVSGQSSRYKNGGAMVYVELNKKDSITVIGKAEYDLQYVYKDPLKRYHIIPVKQFESDTMMIGEKHARASIREFASDSRGLFGKYNINVGEREPRDSVYYIVVDNIDTTAAAIKFYGFKKDSVVRVGEFYDKEIAEQALIDIKKQLPTSKPVLVRRRRLER